MSTEKKEVKPTGRIEITAKDIMQVRGCTATTASKYLTTLRGSLKKKPRNIITVFEVATDLQIPLQQLLDSLNLPYV